MPTLGRNTLGDSAGTGDSGANAFLVGQMPSAGIVSAMGIGAQGFFGAASAKLAIYTGDASKPIGSPLATGDIAFADGVASIQSVTGLSVSLNSGDYVWLAVLDGGGAGGVSYSRDSTTSGYAYAQRNATYPTLPAPFGTPDYNDTRSQRTAFITYGSASVSLVGRRSRLNPGILCQ